MVSKQYINARSWQCQSKIRTSQRLYYKDKDNDQINKDKDKDLKLVLKESSRTRTRTRTKINITEFFLCRLFILLENGLKS